MCLGEAVAKRTGNPAAPWRVRQKYQCVAGVLEMRSRLGCTIEIVVHAFAQHFEHRLVHNES